MPCGSEIAFAFWRNIPPQSSRFKNESSKKPEEASLAYY
jgi:hypothetical protein